MEKCIIRNIAVAGVMAVSAISAQAQENGRPASFWDNTYVGISGGVAMRPSTNITEKEGWSSDLLSGRGGIYFGKWVSPYVAVQADYLVGQAPWTHYIYNTLTANAVLDVMAVVKGYNPDRHFQVLPFIGMGGSFTNNSTSWNLAFGLRARYNFSKRFGFNIGVRGDLLNNQVIEKRGIYGTSLLATVEAGVSIRLGRQGFGKDEGKEGFGMAQAQITELANEVNRLRAEVEQLKKEQADAKKAEEDSLKKVYYTEPNDNKLYIYIRFSEFSSYLSEKERKNIENIGGWMKEQPDFLIKIAAFSDNLSDKKYDNDLRQKRAEAIRQILINNYKIEPARIVITTPEKEGYINKTDCSAMIVFIPANK